jgi:hypothetical protein
MTILINMLLKQPKSGEMLELATANSLSSTELPLEGHQDSLASDPNP